MRSININSNNVSALKNLGNIFLDQRKPEKAIEYY